MPDACPRGKADSAHVGDGECTQDAYNDDRAPGELEIVDVNTLRFRRPLRPPDSLGVSYFCLAVKLGEAMRYVNFKSNDSVMQLVEDPEMAGLSPGKVMEILFTVEAATGTPISARFAVQVGDTWMMYSRESNEVAMRPPLCPAAPTLALLDGAERLKIAWDAVRFKPDVTTYSVVVIGPAKTVQYVDFEERRLSKDAQRCQWIPAEVNCIDVDLPPLAARYSARVAARNDIGWSCYSARSEEVDTTPLSLEAPVLALLEDNLVQVTWHARESDIPVEGYSLLIEDGRVTKYFDYLTGSLLVRPEGAQCIPSTCQKVVLPKDFDWRVAATAIYARVAAKDRYGWGQHSERSNGIETGRPKVFPPMLSLAADGALLEATWEPCKHAHSVKHYSLLVYDDRQVRYYDHSTKSLIQSAQGAAKIPGTLCRVAFTGSWLPKGGLRARLAAESTSGWSEFSGPSLPPLKLSVPTKPASPTLEFAEEGDGRFLAASWQAPKAGSGEDEGSKSLPITYYSVVVEEEEASEKRKLYYDHDSKKLLAAPADATLVPGDATSVNIMVLAASPGKCVYRVAVAARNSSGWGPYSAWSTSLKRKPKQIHQQIHPPTPSLRLETDGSIRAHWIPPTVEGTADFSYLLIFKVNKTQLYYHATLELLVEDASKAVLVPQSRKVAYLEDVQVGKKYRARLLVGAASGWGRYSPWSEAVELGADFLASPWTPTLEAYDSTSILVRWEAVHGCLPVAFYTIEMQVDGSTFFVTSSGSLVEQRRESTRLPSGSRALIVKGLSVQGGEEIAARVLAMNKAAVTFSAFSRVFVMPYAAAEATAEIDGQAQFSEDLQSRVPTTSRYSIDSE
eukprot:TRINITY_DN41960_c0_g1_i1.p1 TRINITY_DN41960_c0_g1~~TRINITY_DN41960_c0_g1_i1.p1  ORF type:complete len:849 (+),score=104.40 TRINITY_DN41960_c0_g1_i1:337-2883(+)